jgi:hypothetical protein
MSSQVAVKRLSAVEVDPLSSHQHEFNAGRLRVALGFDRETVSGRLIATYHGDVGDPEADADSGEYTLYDARADHPSRSEYRLYYKTPLFARRARAGDLLVLFREPGSDDLTAFVAQSGSDAERAILDGIFAGVRPSLEAFFVVAPPAPTAAQVEGLMTALTPRPIVETYGATGHPAYEMALAADKLPPTGAMAKAAFDLVRHVDGTALSPDDRLEHGLEAETELYYAISDELGERRLKALVGEGAGFRAIAAYVSGVKQAAKSRRGTSLQNHFRAVLEDAGIPYTPQCETESGETPDFIVPSCLAYHDLSYAAARLRMIACKSTVKERWRQVLKEANRISVKYFLTLDPGLTDDTIKGMREASIRPFLPRSVLERHYAERQTLDELSTVADLIAELGAIV